MGSTEKRHQAAPKAVCAKHWLGIASPGDLRARRTCRVALDGVVFWPGIDQTCPPTVTAIAPGQVGSMPVSAQSALQAEVVRNAP